MDPALTGDSIRVFVVLTALFLFCAGLIGHTVALAWGSWQEAVGYCLLLSFAYRFLVYGLNQGVLWSGAGFASALIPAWVLAILFFRLSRTRLMLRQYPWRYRRKALVFWTEID